MAKASGKGSGKGPKKARPKRVDTASGSSRAQPSSSRGARPKTARKSGGMLTGFKANFDLMNETSKADGAAIVSFLITNTASKSVAVNAAVTNQLVKEGKWPPNDLTRVMNAIPYRYSANTMRNFLDGVQATLAAGLPPYSFTWNSAFVSKVLPMTVAALMGEVELATT
jgi:hypothetical protein